MTHYISSAHLSLERVKEIIDAHEDIALSEEAVQTVLKCRRYLDTKMEDIGRPVYGVTTGFGSLCNVTIPADKLSQLQYNLVVSHACGSGETVRPEIVKLMLLLKVQSLSYGHSGAQLVTVQRLVDMFNRDILPVVYQHGSLGASGDLAPLAHLSLPLLGLGEVLYKGKEWPSAEVAAEMGWEPITLQSKEGLALLKINLCEGFGAEVGLRSFFVGVPSLLADLAREAREDAVVGAAHLVVLRLGEVVSAHHIDLALFGLGARQVGLGEELEVLVAAVRLAAGVHQFAENPP